MNLFSCSRRFAGMLLSSAAIGLCASSPAGAAGHPAPVEGDWVAPSFVFHNGQSLDNLRLHYVTIGNPGNPAVLVLHGTYQTAGAMLGKDFGGELFGPGQPLDASKYFIVIPDGIGVGKSTKPSDGLRAAFPQYNYADMVLAQYRMLTEGLGIRRLRLIIGNSMGGMQTWLWGGTYPGFADALVPMASQPTEMSSRNWMMRRLLVESIRQDPAWNNGNYTVQPPSLRLANSMFVVATNGGTLAYQQIAGTRAQADKLVDERLAAPVTADANDFIYQWGSSADYNAMPGLPKIKVPLLAINSADDERNPPETGLLQDVLKGMPNAQLLLIPASVQTRGHGTTGMARFYARQLDEFIKGLPAR
ncbi:MULTISPECIES: alpha/beta fold hydrolase [unclassified Herbaspirillum]|uniref:alpha/beta fold hydrolase n=1 Tax=unclassified Herbaspirillum TaxID=2624150 RepID=UPI00114F0146|nr:MULTISPECIES: alpha/beta fold hydrolase [unclassified Herbaspirillum]MBB5390692.1 homoserine O-acetyltransferase [Herbaspirillum sp. SJZ102]TQK08822.1 homoserine O-acetyltransferase [Herbaspirillum sp. SJZ130]TQK14491.1 homoserine O-acetyltransferase [Herbaspirillum sp. SJZ106]TWC66492.1 homoserine O-acetyltransferase [Herbaspirillum sp. SJZ099]